MMVLPCVRASWMTLESWQSKLFSAACPWSSSNQTLQRISLDKRIKCNRHVGIPDKATHNSYVEFLHKFKFAVSGSVLRGDHPSFKKLTLPYWYHHDRIEHICTDIGGFWRMLIVARPPLLTHIMIIRVVNILTFIYWRILCISVVIIWWGMLTVDKTLFVIWWYEHGKSMSCCI